MEFRLVGLRADHALIETVFLGFGFSGRHDFVSGDMLFQLGVVVLRPGENKPWILLVHVLDFSS